MYSRKILLVCLLILVFVLRTWYGTTMFSGEDALQVYLIGLKWFTTGLYPFWGPDVVYTNSFIPGALQGILVGGPFFLTDTPMAPYLFVNLLSVASLAALGWYLSRRIPEVPQWFLYGWLFVAPWALRYSTMVENPSYVLPAAVMFFTAIWDIFPIYTKPLLHRNWSFFALGFSLLWVMQLHLSWVLMLPFLALAFWFQFKRSSSIGKYGLWFLLGVCLAGSTLFPTLWWYGTGSSNGLNQNIAINPANILQGVNILGRYLSLAGGETVRFMGANNPERLAFLYDYPWAAPFTVLFTVLGLLQVGYLMAAFFIKKSLPEWKHIRLFAAATFGLLWASYLFTTQYPKAHAFYLLMPVAMWYGFHAWADLFQRRFIRIMAAALLLTGVVFQIAMALKNNARQGLANSWNQVEQAIRERDYTVLGHRRESIMDGMLRPDLWRSNNDDGRLVFTSGFEYPDPYTKPQNVSSKFAHSGQYSCKMDTISPFGLNFKRAIVPDKKRVACTFSGYVRGGFQGDAQVVLDLRASGKNVFWAGKDVPKTYCVSNEWQLLSGAFNIPDTTARWDEVHVFIWLSSKNSGQLWLDDVTISLQ